MCIDLERWGGMEAVIEAVRRADRDREREVRRLIEQCAPVAGDPVPATAEQLRP